MSEGNEIDVNGDAKVILFRIHAVERRLESMDAKLEAAFAWQRDRQLCPKPGLCMALETHFHDLRKDHNATADKLDSTRRLVWMGLGMVLLVSLGVPIAIAAIFKL